MTEQTSDEALYMILDAESIRRLYNTVTIAMAIFVAFDIPDPGILVTQFMRVSNEVQVNS